MYDDVKKIAGLSFLPYSNYISFQEEGISMNKELKVGVMYEF